MIIMAPATLVSLVYCVGFLSLRFAVAAPADVAYPSVTIPDFGTVVGNVVFSGDVHEYLGIPYAEPPIGDRRWQAPTAASPLGSRPYNATYYRASCIQTRGFSPPMGILSEDCLYLNIYKPSKAKFRLPVLVWFHGGGFANGGGNESRLNGTWDALQSGQHIIVTLNYRLNVFGFLGSDELRSRNEDGSTGAYGIQDQRLALLWVTQHIAAFGGNPQNITIFGESAGAWSVTNHLVMEKSWQYFHRAIMESGGFGDKAAHSWKSGLANFQTVLNKTNCTSVDCLLKLDPETLLAVSGGLSFAPLIDGIELTDYPLFLLQKGHFSRVPLVIGANRDEGASFIGDTPNGKNMSQSDFISFIGERYGFTDPADVTLLLTLYNGEDYNSSTCCSNWWWAASRLVGDQKMICAARIGGLNASSFGVPVYVYNFQHVPQVSGNEFVYHSAEIPYVFNVQTLLDGEKGLSISKAMSRYWLNFANSSDPNAAVFPVTYEWPEFSTVSDWTLLIKDDPSIEHQFREHQCNFWSHHWQFV